MKIFDNATFFVTSLLDFQMTENSGSLNGFILLIMVLVIKRTKNRKFPTNAIDLERSVEVKAD